MVYTHLVTMPGGTGVFHPVAPVGTGFREWTFLPPIIAMYCRADGFPAAPVYNYTQIIAKRIDAASFCHMYDSAISGNHLWAATIVEADPCEYKVGVPTGFVYDTLHHLPAMPTEQSVLYGPTGWGTSLSMIASGGNNDGAPCGRICLDQVDNTDSKVHWIASPSIVHLEQHFSYFSYWRMDWTGGANWATVDVYITERRKNTSMH